MKRSFFMWNFHFHFRNPFVMTTLESIFRVLKPEIHWEIFPVSVIFPSHYRFRGIILDPRFHNSHCSLMQKLRLRCRVFGANTGELPVLVLDFFLHFTRVRSFFPSHSLSLFNLLSLTLCIFLFLTLSFLSHSLEHSHCLYLSVFLFLCFSFFFFLTFSLYFSLALPFFFLAWSFKSLPRTSRVISRHVPFHTRRSCHKSQECALRQLRTGT